MSTNRDGSGWVVEGSSDLSPEVLQDAPTRMVPADFSRDQLPEGSEGYLGADATVLAKPIVDTEKPVDRRSAQYIPSLGMRNTGEVTNVWSSQRTGVSEIFDSVKNLFKPRRTKILFVVCLVSLCTVVTLSCIKTSRNPSMDIYGAKQDHHAEVFEQQSPKSNSEDQSNLANEEVINSTPASLKAAADALVDGRLVEALGFYRQLAKTSPEDESFALAVQILSRSTGGQ